jgi:hypothetical protein
VPVSKTARQALKKANLQKNMFTMIPTCSQADRHSWNYLRLISILKWISAIQNPYLCLMVQTILVVLIFGLAVFYVGRMIYKNFTAKSNCASGCGKCGAVDFASIEKQLREKNF